MWKDSETKIDYLNFGYIVDVIKEMVTDKDITPSTIGVYGDWGSGKSSIMKMVEEKISQNRDKKVIFVHFNGWLFEGYEDAKTALCGTILETIAKENTLRGNIRKRARALLKKVDVQKLLGKGVRYGLDFFMTGGIGTLAGLTFGAITEVLKEKADSMSSEDFEKLFKQCKIENEKRTEIKDFQGKFAKLIDDSKIDNLIVFIDELDRCEPDTILDIFSAMRLFLFAKGTSFVIGADERLIQYAIKTKYREVVGNNLDISKEYLEKVIQYPVNIPILSDAEVEQYIALLLLEKELAKTDFDKILQTVPKLKPSEKFEIAFLKDNGIDVRDDVLNQMNLAHQIAYSLSTVINGNPRQCKRFLNTLYMRMAMAKSRDVILKRAVVAKLMLLEYYLPTVYDKVIDPSNKKTLELLEQEGNESIDYGNLKDFESSDWLKNWLNIDVKLSGENLLEYYYFTRKSARINQHFKSLLSLRANECYADLKSGTDTKRSHGLEIAKELSPAELSVIHGQIFDEMMVDEELNSNLLKSFTGLGQIDNTLKITTLDRLKEISLEKYSVGSVGQLGTFAKTLTSPEANELWSYLEKKSELKTAIATLKNFTKRK